MPAYPYADPNRGIATSVEWAFGSAIGYLPYIGQYARLAKKEGVALRAYFWGPGILVLVAAVLGLCTSLLTGAYDPVLWMVEAGGAGWGMLGLLLIVLANITSTALLIYSQGVIVRSRWPRVPWKWAVLTALPALAFCWNSTVYDGFNKLLAFQAIFYGTTAAVIVTDLFIVRRYRLSLIDLYDQNGVYKYVGGFNILAWLSVGAGAVYYILMYNPLTDTAYSSVFTYIGAGFPTMLVTGVVYLALTYAASRVWSANPAMRLRTVGPGAFEPLTVAPQMEMAQGSGK